MSKMSDYRHDNFEHLNQRAAADMRLRLLTLKDLAHAFLEELDTVGGDEAAGLAAAGPIDFYDEVRRFEVELIQSALRRTNGVQTEAAALLGLKPSTLHAKLKLYGLSAADFTLRVASAGHHAVQGDGGGYGEESRGHDNEDHRELAYA